MMRALRWHGAQDLRVEQIPIPQPGPQDVRIAVQYCGICGSDLHEYESGPHAIPVGTPHAVSGRTAPLTLGHEFCGTVVEVGNEVSHLQVGDRVAVEPEYRCSHCAYCRSGAYNLCADMGFAGLMGDGGMAEFAVVPSYMLHRLPSGVSLEQAAVMEPAAVALHALRRSQLPAGGSCAIFGLGPIGLLLVKLAKLQGAGTIIAVDVSPERLHMARQAGASLVIDGKGLSAHELRRTIASATGGLGVDTSFEAAGLQATFEGAIRALRKGGNMVMVGLMSEARFDAFEAVNRELSLVASVGYRDVYQALIGLIEAGDFDPTSIITKTVPLERAVSEGFAALVQDRSQIKILVSPAMAHHNTLQDKPMTHSMEDKVILITGGTSGIGANTALHFAHAGASVLAIGLDAEGLHAPRHPRIQCLELDVCDSAKLSQTIGELPRLDALVNAAGISRHAEEYQPEAFLQVLHTNLTAVMQASMAAAPLLLKSGGCIVNVASMFSYFGSKDRPAYSASKGGIVQLTRSLAQTWAHEGVRVNAVAPGWIATPLSEGLMADPQASAKILSRTPLQRWGHAAEVAEVIGFLCSPAASFVNGAVIPVDGGYLTA